MLSNSQLWENWSGYQNGVHEASLNIKEKSNRIPFLS